MTIPKSVKKIEWSAFSGCPNLTISTLAGSQADKYARSNGIRVKNI